MILRNSRRLTAVLLSLIMLLGLVPAMAFTTDLTLADQSARPDASELAVNDAPEAALAAAADNVLMSEPSIIDGLTRGLNFTQYPRLVDVYADYFLIGTAGDSGSVASPRGALIARHYNAWTFENSMKPTNFRSNAAGPQSTINAVRPLPANNGYTNQIAFIGHTLAWHSQSPALWNPANQALSNMQSHIETVMMRYGHELHSMDVVNEPVGATNPNDPADWRFAFNKTEGWALTLGPEWIEHAFRFTADVVDREGMDVILYINDFGLDSLAKARAMYEAVKEINERNADYRKDPVTGLPNGKLLIEGIGMQGHYGPNTNMQNVAHNIALFGSLGVLVSFTEVDFSWNITDPSGNLTLEQEIVQAQKYAEFFQILKKYAAGPANPVAENRFVERVTFWGTSDGNSWRSSNRPLLFNAPSGGQVTGKEALLGVLDPDRYLEIHPLPEPVPIVIPGVHMFNVDEGDAFTGANIILGNDANAWPWSTGAEDGLVAFTPIPGGNYNLRVDYTVRGAPGIQARWISDNATSFTAADIAALPSGTIASGATANSIPTRFHHTTVNNGNAQMNVNFTLPANAQPGGLIGNIAIRGLNGDPGIEIDRIIITDRDSGKLLVNWPELVVVIPRGAEGFVVGDPVENNGSPGGGRANIVVGAGTDVWPWSESLPGGERAFAPEPGATYRLSFNVTNFGANGWRIRWTANADTTENYTPADVPAVNNHDISAISGIGYGLVTARNTSIANRLPTRWQSGVNVASQVYTMVAEVTFGANVAPEGLIGNIALRGNSGSGAFNINWIRVEKLTGGTGSPIDELVAFWPHGIDNPTPDFTAQGLAANAIPTINTITSTITRQGGGAINAQNPPRPGDVLVGAIGSTTANTQLNLVGQLNYTWRTGTGANMVVHQSGPSPTFRVTNAQAGMTLVLDVTSSFETGTRSSTATVAVSGVTCTDHVWLLDEDAYIAPLCESDGADIYYCSTCFITKAEAIEALGHVFADPVQEGKLIITRCTREGCDFEKSITAAATYEDFTPPHLLKRQSIAPDLMTMWDGTPVDSPEQWVERRKEVRRLLEYYFYGPVPEEVVYHSHTVGAANNSITVSVQGGASPDTVRAFGAVTITYPTTPMPEGGYPLLLGGLQEGYWRSLGFATAAIPTANTVFRQLYPHVASVWTSNTGAYGLTSWNVAQLIEGLEAEAAGENRLRIDPTKVAVSGASTNGKRAAAIGAMADKVWMSMPGAGGTGGVNLYRQNSANTVWDMFSGPSTLAGAPGSFPGSTPGGGSAGNGLWGPIGLAEAWGGHAGWEGNFGYNYGIIPFRNADFAPVDAHFVAAMYARPNSYYYPATGISNEGTNGVPGLQQTIDLALPAFELIGQAENLGARITRSAHGHDIEASVVIAVTLDHASGKHGDCDGFCDLEPYFTSSVSAAAQTYLRSLNFNVAHMHITPFKSVENADTWERIQPCCNGDCVPCECPEWCPHTADTLCCDPGVPVLDGEADCIYIDFLGPNNTSRWGVPRFGLGWNQAAGSGTLNAAGLLEQRFTNHGGGIIFTVPLGENKLGYYNQLSFDLRITNISGAEPTGPTGVVFVPDRSNFPGSGNWWDSNAFVSIRMERAYAGLGVLGTYVYDLTTPYLDATGAAAAPDIRGITNYARSLSGDIILAIGRNNHTQTMEFGNIRLRAIGCEDDCQACVPIVTFDADGGTLAGSAEVGVIKGGTVAAPAPPVKAGYTFQGWFLDGVLYDFDSIVLESITLAAKWDLNATSVRIGQNGTQSAPMLAVKRNEILTFEALILEVGAVAEITWSVNNANLATVDQDGKVTIKGMAGNATLTIRDGRTGLTHSIILRIA